MKNHQDEIRVSKIVVCSEDSDNETIITPDGIWVGTFMVSASIQMTDGRPMCTVSNHTGKSLPGHQIVLSVTDDREPCVQITRPNGQVSIIRGEALMKLIEEGKNHD